ncbi:hypothetical protein BRADI_1g46254v3 [Brachypodium distachyon]|uniref:Uncharacterized protein n=1 Tax=Brachypodium distachyon TaxID=15368 RepID=A0A2K2DPP0_BRADI|nr:hypothetical protein BRADI_1g46254v3 [Brachypodium distachyon]
MTYEQLRSDTRDDDDDGSSATCRQAAQPSTSCPRKPTTQPAASPLVLRLSLRARVPPPEPSARALELMAPPARTQATGLVTARRDPRAAAGPAPRYVPKRGLVLKRAFKGLFSWLPRRRLWVWPSRLGLIRRRAARAGGGKGAAASRGLGSACNKINA